MNFQGRLKLLHGQNEKTPEGKPIPPQLALFALACPVQPPSILEIRAKNFFFRTKHKLDFTPTACDAKWVTCYLAFRTVFDEYTFLLEILIFQFLF